MGLEQLGDLIEQFADSGPFLGEEHGDQVPVDRLLERFEQRSRIDFLLKVLFHRPIRFDDLIDDRGMEGVHVAEIALAVAGEEASGNFRTTSGRNVDRDAAAATLLHAEPRRDPPHRRSC